MSVLLALGDSHASSGWGLSWPDHLSSFWDMSLIRASSPGAGNSFYIEKLHYVLRTSKIDKVVIQLTSPTRVVTGFKYYETKTQNTVSLEDGNKIDDIGCYTWNIRNNESNIKNILHKDTKIDNIWIPNVGLSKWIDYKVMQDIITMQYLCDTYNVTCVFWSWSVPMKQLFIKPYDWLKTRILWVEGCGEKWLTTNRILPTEDNVHFSSDAHYRLVSEWLKIELDKKFDVN